jgi:hypothetical protein
MGGMDQLLNACEGDQKLCPKTFRMGTVVLVNKILKPITIDLLALNFLGSKP